MTEEEASRFWKSWIKSNLALLWSSDPEYIRVHYKIETMLVNYDNSNITWKFSLVRTNGREYKESLRECTLTIPKSCRECKEPLSRLVFLDMIEDEKSNQKYTIRGRVEGT